LEHHSIANLFPLLEGTKFDSLKADIAENGLLQPIVVYDGQILDGRNRHRACVDLSIEYASVEYDGDNPTAFVWAMNGVRRHLSTGQLTAIGVKMLPLFKKDGQKRQLANLKYSKQFVEGSKRTPRIQGKATKKAAAIVGVGATTIWRADYVKKNDPELFKKIESGEISPWHAEQQIKNKSSKKKRRHAPRKQRVAEIKQLVSKGYIAQQIANELGIGVERIRDLAREDNIQLHDFKMVNLKQIDADALVERTVTSLDAIALGLRVIKNAELTITPELAAEYVAELSQAFKELNWLKTRMEEITK